MKFSPRIYIINSLKLAKVFKLAVSSNSKNFFTPTLLHQLLNSMAQFQCSFQINISFFLFHVTTCKLTPCS